MQTPVAGAAPLHLWNQAVQTLEPYQTGKPMEELARELGLTDIIKLASNENPLGPGPAVQQVLQQAAGALNRYPDGSGYRLKQALAERLGVPAAAITLGNGSNDVLELIAKVVLTPGKQVVVSEHAFVVYELATIANAGVLVKVPARDFGADLPAMLAAINADTRLLFLANPNNPTGTWVDRSTICQFLDQVPAQVLVVLDEAYFEYLQHPDYPDGISLMAQYPNLVVTRTFSKIHALAALRVGYAVSSLALADLLNRVRQPFNVSSLGLACAEAALGDAAHLQASLALNQAGLEQLYAGFAALQLPYIRSGGNFVAVDFGQPALPIYQALLQLGVIVRPVGSYGMPQHLRITVGTEAENRRLLQALQQVLGA